MNMFKGLLFLDGHFTRPDDLDDALRAGRAGYGARTAAADLAPPLGNRAASAAWWARSTSGAASSEVVVRRSTTPSRPRANFLGHLRYLGGRPMHAGHNTDIEEPFASSEEEQGGAAGRRHAQGKLLQGCMQACNG